MSGLGTLPLGLRQTLHRAFGDVAVKTSISSNGNRPLRKSINTSKDIQSDFPWQNKETPSQ